MNTTQGQFHAEFIWLESKFPFSLPDCHSKIKSQVCTTIYNSWIENKLTHNFITFI